MHLPGLVIALLITAGPGGLSVNYQIDCTLNETSSLITGHQLVAIRNETDWSFNELWFQLHPRAFRNRTTALARDLSAMKSFDLAWAAPAELGDLTIGRLLVDDIAPVDTLLHETELELRLRSPFRPGDSLVVVFEFATKLPRFFTSLLGRQNRFYFLNHWHPQLAAWQNGKWHIGGVEPAGAAPAQIADYDVTVTLPEDLRVAATGERLTIDTTRPNAGAYRVRYSASNVAGFALVAGPDLLIERSYAAGIEITACIREQNQPVWQGLSMQAAAIIETYAGWYGPPPFNNISIIDATGIVPADVAVPGIVLLSGRPIPFARLSERSLSRQLAFQWFAPAGAPDPAGSSWVVTGPAVLSQLRYMETRYGPSNLLDLPWEGPLAGFGDKWFNQLLYYLAASNRTLGSLAEPEFDYTTNPLSYSESRFAQAGGFFTMLQRRLGAENLDRALRSWLTRTDRESAPDSAFITACSDITDTDINWLFKRWLNAKGPCDYAITGVNRHDDEYQVAIRRVGAITMPVEVELAFADGTRVRRSWDLPVDEGIIEIIPPARLKSVTLDPDRLLFESDRWNNHWPRRVSVYPLFALPSFEEYQLFYGPYPWYDDYHGLQLGGWLQGRQFIEAGPLHGRHSWSVIITRSFRLNDWQTGAWYATPLPFLSEQLRFSAAARYSPRATSVDVILEQGLSPVLRRDGATIQLAWLLQDLHDPVGRDPRAWQTARTSDLTFRLQRTTESHRLRESGSLDISWGSRWLGGEYGYGKASIEQHGAIRLTRTSSVNVRLFAGGIIGSVPRQSRIYLSGGLTATPEEPVSWAYQGPASGQKNWHYTADVNCRGWAGEYLAGHYGWGANVHLNVLPLVRPYVQPFFDIGNVGSDLADPALRHPRMDAGVRLKVSWLYADFPLWRWEPGVGSELIFKWMVGINLAGFADF